MVWDEILRAREMWLGSKPSDLAWPERGIAIEGDFAGIQQYVLKPVPAQRVQRSDLGVGRCRYPLSLSWSRKRPALHSRAQRSLLFSRADDF